MRAMRLMFFAVFLATVACSDQAPVSGPGTMTVTLVGPNGAEGAALVSLLGDGVGEIAGLGNTEAYAETNVDGTRLVLINQLGGDLAFQVAVTDTTDLPAWVVSQVAGPDDGLRADVRAYTLAYSR
jgi:hypothetical protein